MRALLRCLCEDIRKMLAHSQEAEIGTENISSSKVIESIHGLTKYAKRCRLKKMQTTKMGFTFGRSYCHPNWYTCNRLKHYSRTDLDKHKEKTGLRTSAHLTSRLVDLGRGRG